MPSPLYIIQFHPPFRTVLFSFPSPFTLPSPCPLFDCQFSDLLSRSIHTGHFSALVSLFVAYISQSYGNEEDSSRFWSQLIHSDTCVLRDLVVIVRHFLTAFSDCACLPTYLPIYRSMFGLVFMHDNFFSCWLAEVAYVPHLIPLHLICFCSRMCNWYTLPLW